MKHNKNINTHENIKNNENKEFKKDNTINFTTHILLIYSPFTKNKSIIHI